MVYREELTPKQEAVLNVIKKKLREKGYPPSVREIGAEVGLSSSSTVHGYLRKLEEKGYLRRDPTLPRAIEVIDDQVDAVIETVNVPLVGQVAAGVPILGRGK